ncbi:DUF4317 family protein [Alkalicoccus urumqiensis]|uniref:DUF4317 domain-containing protein n=1 Tax=Alkalicoccus urumqiensis TaxID=1548213 RepID=A0A2P6MIP6_ALKUR|nr:DUF4317 family protein [Alkalicoccus urumqiensis]PRO66175.1 hypothetical protein C6I21_05065 [Alkalicoccus urumqiensis]
MDKKDIAAVRRYLKPGQTKLQIQDLFNVYVMKDTTDVYHAQSQPFDMIDQEEQELYTKNFKKILTGRLDEKLFELKFQHESPSQLLLHKALLTESREEWQGKMLTMAEKMIADNPQETDTVLTFIRANYYQSSGRAGSDDDSAVVANSFILCVVNKTEQPEREIQFDYVEKEFKYKVEVDPVIDLKHPLTGFFFPAVTDGAADVNRLLYAAVKANEPDEHMIQEVLGAEDVMTAQEDKAVFEEVVREVIGDQLPPATLANVYGEINRMIEEGEEEGTPPTLDYRDVEKVLSASGQQVESEQVKAAFQNVTTEESYEMKASSIVPKYESKSIKIKTKAADITISPQDLQYVRQVQYDNRRCIMIDIDEDAEVDGFRMLPEAFSWKVEDPEDEE